MLSLSSPLRSCHVAAFLPLPSLRLRGGSNPIAAWRAPCSTGTVALNLGSGTLVPLTSLKWRFITIFTVTLSGCLRSPSVSSCYDGLPQYRQRVLRRRAHCVACFRALSPIMYDLVPSSGLSLSLWLLYWASAISLSALHQTSVHPHALL